MDDILHFDSLIENANNKMKTKQNNKIFIKGNVGKFSMIDNNKLLKISKEKIMRSIFDKNSKIIQNFIVTKNEFIIFQKKNTQIR